MTFIALLASISLFEESHVFLRRAIMPVYIVLVIFVGIRGFGFDYGVYKEQIYNKLPSLIELTSGTGISLTTVHGEIGYKLLNIASSFLGFSFTSFLLIFSAFTLSLSFRSFYRYSPYFFIALLLYLPRIFAQDMGQVRAGFVQAAILFSFHFILKRQKWPFLITILLASTIQSSALIALPLYAITNGGKTLRFSTVVILSFSLLFLLNFNWINWFADFFGYGGFLRYINREEYGGDVGLTIGMLKIPILTIWYLYLTPRIDKQYRTLFTLMIIALNYSNFVSIVFHEVFIFSARLSSPLSVVQYILTPIALTGIKNNEGRLIVGFGIILLAGYKAFSFLTSNADVYIPYIIGE